MHAAIVVWLLALGGWAVVSALVIAFAPRAALPAGVAGVVRRLRAAADGAAPSLTRPALAVVVALTVEAAAVIVFFVLGRLAKALEPHVDVPVFHWFEARQLGWWSDYWLKITKIGSPTVTQTVLVIAAVLLALQWRKRRWWVPVVVLVLGYLMEKYGQNCLQTIVHRGHPPTTLGTWPSGGMARIWVVYGLTVFFALKGSRTRNPRLWAAGLAVVLLCETIQAYSRTYNLEHWLTDVIGGFLFGLFLLTGLLAVQWVLDRGSEATTAPAVRAAGQHRQMAPTAARGS